MERQAFRVLIVFSVRPRNQNPIKNLCSWEAAGFLCFILDTQLRKITIELLFFHASKNNFPLPSCVAFSVIENSIHPSYLHRVYGGVAVNMGGVATDKGGRSNSTLSLIS